MNEQAKLFLPPHLLKKQMIPTDVALRALEKALKQQRRQALYLFRGILLTTESTKDQMVAQIDALLSENEIAG